MPKLIQKPIEVPKQYRNQGFDVPLQVGNRIYAVTKNGLLAANLEVLEAVEKLKVVIGINNPIDYYDSEEFDDVYRLTGRILYDEKTLNLLNGSKLVHSLGSFMGGDSFYLEMRERLGTPKLPFMFTGSVYRFGEKNNGSAIQVIKRFHKFDKKRNIYLDVNEEPIVEGHSDFIEISDEQARLLRLREKRLRYVTEYDENAVPIELTENPTQLKDKLSIVPEGDRAVVRGFDRGLNMPSLCISFPPNISDPNIGIFAAKTLEERLT